MNTLRFTLVTDGPTDAALIYPLQWLLVENRVQCPLEPAWADLRGLPIPPSALDERISAALDLYPCELLFVHRDAERQPPEHRAKEIEQAVHKVSNDWFEKRPYVCVIPVRMTEAWFLFNKDAIRRAAGNPFGRVSLRLPPVAKVEDLPDPKRDLCQLLSNATEKPPRRLKRFMPARAVHRLAELIEDYAPLRQVPAFRSLEADLRQIIEKAGWTR